MHKQRFFWQFYRGISLLNVVRVVLYFLTMDELKGRLYEIDVLKKEFVELRPSLSDNIVKSLKTRVFNEIIHNSTLGKYSSSEDQEILKKALKEALDYIDELSIKKLSELNKKDILNIHYVLFRNTCHNYAGKYRDSDKAWVSLKNGEKAEVCHYSLIPDEMDKYFNWLFSMKNEHPLIIASEAHNKFVSIHPFIDGNGRTGRLIMNLVLLQNGYAPINIKAFIKEKYSDAIKSWRIGEKKYFYSLIVDCEKESLERYLEEIRKNCFT